MIVRLELESTRLYQDFGDLTLIDEECSLSRSDDELTTVLDLIKGGGEAIPEFTGTWFVPLDDLS